MRQRGFTFIELMITVAIMALLASIALPLAEVTYQRNREQDFRHALREIRGAIDAYKRAADEGAIERKADESGYPPTLAALVQGVPDKRYADTGRYPSTLDDLVVKHYLRSIPKDPFTQSASTWVPVPPQDTRKGNVWDVKSGAKGYERY